MRGTVKPLWLSEMVAVWGYVQRNYFLTKRYFMWEVVWLVYVTINAMAITFIGAGVEASGGEVDTQFLELVPILQRLGALEVSGVELLRLGAQVLVNHLVAREAILKGIQGTHGNGSLDSLAMTWQ